VKRYLYTLNPHHARPMKLDTLRRVVERACRYVEKSSNHQVVFEEDKGQARLIGTPSIDFSFAHFGPSEDTARWVMLPSGNAEIRFNYYLSWSTRWWHPFIGRNFDLYTYVVHELGHVLGMYPHRGDDQDYHNPDPASVMHAGPVFPRFTAADIGMLRYLTRPTSPL